MASLLNKSVGSTYRDLLTVLGSSEGQGLESGVKRVFDGEGTGSPLYLGTSSIDIQGNTSITGNLAITGNLSYSGTITGAGFSGGTLSGTTVEADSYRFANSGSQVIALTYNATKSAIVVEQNLRTKGSMTFTATGHDDLIISAASGTLEKGDGSKGKVSLGDTKVSLKKGDTELLSVEEDGTLRMQSVSSEPSSPSSGDMVNIDGEIYIST
jgi:hypothetical protein